MHGWLYWGMLLLPVLFVAAVALCAWRAVKTYRQGLRVLAIGYALEGAFLIVVLVFLLARLSPRADESRKQRPRPSDATSSAAVGPPPR